MANMTGAVKTLVDALTVAPADTESSLVNHAAHHDVIHTALQELYDKTVYLAVLTQASTAAPTATVLENTTGLTVAWSRSNTGTYALTATTAGFTLNKTVATVSSPRTATKDYCFFRETSFIMTLKTYTAGELADDLLTGDYVKVEIYQ